MDTMVLFVLLCSLSMSCNLSIGGDLESVGVEGGSGAGVKIVIRDRSTGESGVVRIPYKIAEFMLRHVSPDSKITANNVEIEMTVLRTAVLEREKGTVLKYEDGQGHTIEIVVEPPDKRAETP